MHLRRTLAKKRRSSHNVSMTSSSHHVISLNAIDPEDSGLVGDHVSRLALLKDASLPLAPGFVISTRAYYAFIQHNNLESKISALIAKVTWKDDASIQKASHEIQKLMLHAKVPEEIVSEVFDTYKKLGSFLKHATVSLQASLSINPIHKSSGISYDAHFLHINGEAELIVKLKEIWAGFFEFSLIKQRYQKHIDSFHTGIAVLVQKTLGASASGFLFTVNPLSHDTQTVLIEAVYGLEQLLIKDTTVADRYEVQKTTGAIVEKKITPQHSGLFLHGNDIREQKIKEADASVQKITNEQIHALVSLAKEVGKSMYFPQQLLWAIEEGRIYVLSCHQITAEVPTNKTELVPPSYGQALLKGIPTCPGIATGTVAIIRKESDIASLHSGDIAVTALSDLGSLRLLHHAAGIIIEKEMTVSATVTLAHELRKPVIVGLSQATKALKHHMVITMNGSNGEIYQGGYGNRANTMHPLTHTTQTQTKVYADLLDILTPIEQVKHVADGIIVHGAKNLLFEIGLHPKQLVAEKRQQEYIHALVEKLDTLCRDISPRPVIFEFSELTTASLRKLSGGKEYEPREVNPALGFHGAFKNQFDHVFMDMEIAAITQLRTKKNHKNLWMSIPFVRTPKELETMKKLLTQKNLYRTPTCKLFFTMDIPGNSINLEKYLDQGIDGVIIRPDHLLSLLLGVDLEHPEVQQQFTINDEVLTSFIHQVTTNCAQAKIPVVISQSSLFHHLDLTERFVMDGIRTVSISPNDIQLMREYVANVEKKLLS